MNVITTHLGLGLAERAAQVRELMGPEWIGAIPEDEPAILCGDFNLPPGNASYRRITAKLRDVQLVTPGHRALKTFSSIRPFMRIDHIFLTPHFEAKTVTVPRTDLTRVSSDHLPLLADLQLAPLSVERPTTKQPGLLSNNTPSPLSVLE